MRVQNPQRGIELAGKVVEADSFGLRLRGLMFRKSLAPGEGLLIHPCKAVHTHFMRFPIDVLFLDDSGRVVHLAPAMAPWRQSPYVREAHSVLELAAGASGPTRVGDQLQFLP